MLISLIAAMDKNRLIGKDNGLPWRLPADLRHFKTITMGKPVIMGRKTHESIGFVLPGRHNIVVTHNQSYSADGCSVVHSFEQALQAAANVDEVVVIGGATLYKSALAKADRLYLTFIEGEFNGDAYFPEFDISMWLEAERQDFQPDEKNLHAYSFVTYERKPS
ncbi:MAG: type 3 dihydrofolate reductase [Deferribacteres bacterium]|nr:type 3 dihydrofolate reductase [candidate division KSB1 bacterium]MCB9509864.1 type 3 dihydrofolate reductase [Deferribacteres bacterium]